MNKAFVRVHIKSAAIFYDEKPTTQQYVTTKPEDDFTIFKVYSGVTSNVKARSTCSCGEHPLPEALERSTRSSSSSTARRSRTSSTTA